MQTISKDKLYYLLETGHAEVTLIAGDVKISVGPRIFISLDFSSSESDIEYRGYTVEFGDESHVSRRFDTLIKRLDKLGAFQGDTCVIDAINGRFITIEEYDNDRAFNELDKNGIIDMYKPLADSFELVVPFCDYSEYDEDHRYGKTKLTHNQATAAAEAVRNSVYKRLHEQYDKEDFDKKAELPPFDEIFNDMMSESDTYANDGLYENGDFYDLFYEGKTKYHEPENVFLHMYSEIFFYLSILRSARSMEKNPDVKPLDRELDDPVCAPLRSKLISVTPVFEWHCTMSGMPSRVFRFTLDDESAQWLKSELYKENVPFEDLAFYSGDRLLYSECTHEGFRNDFTAEYNLRK